MAAQSLQERVNRLQSELTALRQRTNRSTALTLVLGAVVLILLCVYFYFGYTQIASILNAETLVPYAFGRLDEEVPNVRARLEKEIAEGAPQWADQLSKQVVTAIPDARKQLEKYVLERADETFKEVRGMTDDHFKKFIGDNRKELDQMFKDLASNDPTKTQGHIDALEKMADRQLQKEMQDEMAKFTTTLSMANQHFKKLKDGKKLTPDEESERQTLMILRALRSQQDPEKPIPGKATGATKPAAKAPAEKKKEK